MVNSSKVRFTGLVKYSSTFQGDEDTEGTRLYNMTENGLVDEKVYDSKYRLDNPDHIADFIKSTKERLPAKNIFLYCGIMGENSVFGISLWGGLIM